MADDITNWTSDFTHWMGHTFSLGALAGAFTGILPAIAAVVAFMWYALQIYESPTVQKWLTERRTRQIRRLKKKLSLLMEDASLPSVPPESYN